MFNGLSSISQLPLQVRYPQEVHDVKEFITPQQWHVQHKIAELNLNGGVTPEALWDFVCRDIKYPLDALGRPNEYHKLQAYAWRGRYVSGAGWQVDSLVNQRVYEEWFDFPHEVLSQNPMVADCDGSSITLCSLLLGIGQPAYVALGGLHGEFEQLTHAWVVTQHNGDWQVWETTAPEMGMALPIDNDIYLPLAYFNDKEIYVDPSLYDELQKMDYIPGLGQVFAPYGIVKNDIMKRGIINSLCRECLSCSKFC